MKLKIRASSEFDDNAWGNENKLEEIRKLPNFKEIKTIYGKSEFIIEMPDEIVFNIMKILRKISNTDIVLVNEYDCRYDYCIEIHDYYRE